MEEAVEKESTTNWSFGERFTETKQQFLGGLMKPTGALSETLITRFWCQFHRVMNHKTGLNVS